MPLPHSAARNPQSAIGLILGIIALAAPAAAQENPFAAGVRTTPWLSPADEQKQFQLPPGFEINLVAAEPEIQKPLNMAFDERGRIWLTNSVEYPYAAPPDRPGKDTIKVLEDADGDGTFEKVTTFADGLNIPIGIYPWKGGCVAFSIPNIWHLEDTDGDGTCDKRTVLYGPFDTSRDTHGMCNAFRRGFDGWVYACHGFNNDSRVKGKDGHEVHLQSGNTFRFKLDGSRIEHFTHGQVNPFGMCMDHLFNIFTADCHSKPIYQLLRGGCYPSFGKAHDGLGFVPPMMDHLHGSTAICGLVCYSGENFPAAYRGQFLSGNVMTSRLNRNKPEFRGSTIKAIEQPDFLSSGDPWFRPVDLQIGPDGALYILDFYNRIIGHYEVPLPHPGRDRTSGRIWRVDYQGKDGPNAGFNLAACPCNDLTKQTTSELIGLLDYPQLEHRLRALHYLVDVHGESAAEPLTKALAAPKNGTQQTSVLWALERIGKLAADERAKLAVSEDFDVRVHAMKLLADHFAWQPADNQAALETLRTADSFARRAAAEAMAEHENGMHLVPLLDALGQIPTDDNHAQQMVKMAIRDTFVAAWEQSDLQNLGVEQLSEAQARRLAPLAATVKNPRAATWLFHGYLRRFADTDEATVGYVELIAANLDVGSSKEFCSWVKTRAAGSVDLELRFIQAVAKGADAPWTAGRLPFGVHLWSRDEARKFATEWATEVCGKHLKPDAAAAIGWSAHPLPGSAPSESPWTIQPRNLAGESTPTLCYSSLPLAETRTGIYRSGTFAIPEKLSFWCAGHSGLLNQPISDKNWVRLRDAKTGDVLAEIQPPRSDSGKLAEWNLTKHAGQQGYLELVDGDSGTGWAWLAVGRFSLTALNPSDAARNQEVAAELIGKLKLSSFRPELISLLANPATNSELRLVLAEALVALRDKPDARATALVAGMKDSALPAELRQTLAKAIEPVDGAAYQASLKDLMKVAPQKVQTTLAEILAGDAAGAKALLALVEAGVASPRLLLAANIANKLTALKSPELDSHVKSLIAKLPPASETLEKLIQDRLKGYPQAATSVERGQAAFAKHCAACHQIAGKGAIVGPQLDGIGGRGLARLVEDVLDPNRNVDVAFRTTTLRLADGRVVSGLVRREEGSQLVLADNQGKEFAVPKSDIDEQQKTPLSLMPANVGEIVPEAEFFDLLSWLLRVPAAKPVSATP
ncbi:MAG: c-type cytochrome [Pirellulaceae bacterium]|nr:c-type cytochrome [Pirellulaceae bacterium]